MTTRADDPTTDRRGRAATPAELIDRARALRPMLLELQEEHAELGTYSKPVHDAFVEAGLYNILRPRRYGGYEYGLDTYFRVVVEIARADPGVGWAFELASSHNWQTASFWPERAQDELFAADPYIASSRALGVGATAVRVDGGYLLSGTWDYNSGCTYGTHALQLANVDGPEGPVPHMFAVPRSEYTIVDDWGGDRVIGMQASSSNSITMKDVFVPEHMAVVYDWKDHPWGAEGTAGYQLHQNPLYLGRTQFFFFAGLISTVLGAAWAAHDEYGQLMERATSFPPRMPRSESPEYQRWYGQILSLTNAADILFFGAIDQYAALNRRWTDGGPEFSPQEDCRLRASILPVAQLAGQVVDIAFSSGGSSSVSKKGARLGKYYRDVAMYKTHLGAQFDAVYASTARFAMGQPLTL
jgi:3-hydroxy-9,10-secoandrosta-1,3,5(10)-triene-9,17-dione monooxygenase